MTEQEFQARAEELAREVIAANPIQLGEEAKTVLDEIAEKNLMLETVEYIKHQRRIYLDIITTAEQELKHLQWHDVNVIMLNTIQGVRDKFLVRFGNFIKAKSDGWLLQPTNEKLLADGMRWKSPKKAAKYATNLRQELKGDVERTESEAMKQLKKEIQANLEFLKENW